MSELIITSSAYIINGDSPMTSVANTVAMTTLAVHTVAPYFPQVMGPQPTAELVRNPVIDVINICCVAWQAHKPYGASN